MYPGSLTGGPVPSWRLRGVRVDAGVASTVADVWARAASVEGEKGGLNPAARDRTRDALARIRGR